MIRRHVEEVLDVGAPGSLLIDQEGRVALPDPDGVLDESTARVGEQPIAAERADGAILVDVAAGATPVAVSFRARD